MAASSVDLGLDGTLDAEVRRHWRLLAVAGLPSLATHPSGTNAPHVTLAQRDALPDPDVVRPLAARLPLEVALTGLVVFPTRRGLVLARAVAPSTALLALQAEVAALLGAPEPPAAHTSPGSWSPHVTLGAGLTAAEVALALDLLPLGGLTGHATELRHWVPRTRTLIAMSSPTAP